MARSAQFILAGLLAILLAGCHRLPAVAKLKARRGLELCMSHRAPAIQYAYIGKDAICGVVDAIGYRGLAAGPSPFIFFPKPKIIPPNEGGLDYEDYTLNRTGLTTGELASNAALLVKNCRVPADWERLCQIADSSGKGLSPAICQMMKLRNVLVLMAYTNGCPGSGPSH